MSGGPGPTHSGPGRARVRVVFGLSSRISRQAGGRGAHALPGDPLLPWAWRLAVPLLVASIGTIGTLRRQWAPNLLGALLVGLVLRVTVVALSFGHTPQPRSSTRWSRSLVSTGATSLRLPCLSCWQSRQALAGNTCYGLSHCSSLAVAAPCGGTYGRRPSTPPMDICGCSRCPPRGTATRCRRRAYASSCAWAPSSPYRGMLASLEVRERVRNEKWIRSVPAALLGSDALGNGHCKWNRRPRFSSGADAHWPSPQIRVDGQPRGPQSAPRIEFFGGGPNLLSG